MRCPARKSQLTVVLLLVMLPCAWVFGSSTPQTPAGQAARGGLPEVPSSAPAVQTPGQANEAAEPQAAGNAAKAPVDVTQPMIIMAVGMLVVLGLIIGLKANAFIALITAAMIVSLMAEGPLAVKISRVAEAFGHSAGKIGIVIALAAIIGKCLLDSGAADRIVRSFLRVFGQRQAPVALMGSGFVLAIPVFFDTVFYLLVPLARSLYQKTRRHYLTYVLAIATGGAITHTLVPPTPGPLFMASNLNIPIGLMILVGIVVALPAAIAGLGFSILADRWMPVPMRPLGNEPEPEPLDESELPSLGLSLLPVVLPVILISANTVFAAVAKTSDPQSWLQSAASVSAVLGNANLALLISTLIAIGTLAVRRGLNRSQIAHVVETALMSGGVIILITAGGGAFGKMLEAAKVGLAIESLFSGSNAAGLTILFVGFALAGVLKIAQGSSTVAMITGSAMLAGIAGSRVLGFHPVYLATAIGAGSLVGSWMNDSGFWIFAKMSGLTEVEALKSWTIMLLVLALTALATTMLLAALIPDPTFGALAGGVAP